MNNFHSYPLIDFTCFTHFLSEKISSLKRNFKFALNCFISFQASFSLVSRFLDIFSCELGMTRFFDFEITSFYFQLHESVLF